jgi:hypothetical protein
MKLDCCLCDFRVWRIQLRLATHKASVGNRFLCALRPIVAQTLHLDTEEGVERNLEGMKYVFQLMKVYTF